MSVTQTDPFLTQNYGHSPALRPPALSLLLFYCQLLETTNNEQRFHRLIPAAEPLASWSATTGGRVPTTSRFLGHQHLLLARDEGSMHGVGVGSLA